MFDLPACHARIEAGARLKVVPVLDPGMRSSARNAVALTNGHLHVAERLTVTQLFLGVQAEGARPPSPQHWQGRRSMAGSTCTQRHFRKAPCRCQVYRDFSRELLLRHAQHTSTGQATHPHAIASKHGSTAEPSEAAADDYHLCLVRARLPLPYRTCCRGGCLLLEDLR
jgi:hypothetical protein